MKLEEGDTTLYTRRTRRPRLLLCDVGIYLLQPCFAALRLLIGQGTT
jgi:hypothetical protein